MGARRLPIPRPAILEALVPRLAQRPGTLLQQTLPDFRNALADFRFPFSRNREYSYQESSLATTCWFVERSSRAAPGPASRYASSSSSLLLSSLELSDTKVYEPWRRGVAHPLARELVIDNLLVRIHLIIVMIGWTGLACCAWPSVQVRTCCFFFTLVTGPRRSLSLKLSDTRVYEP